ncbi:hypothetical protein Tco_1372120 [Tanacetum coccineum]
MPAANNSNKRARQRKRSARLITVVEISRHYGKSFEEAADILGGEDQSNFLCRDKDVYMPGVSTVGLGVY